MVRIPATASGLAIICGRYLFDAAIVVVILAGIANLAGVPWRPQFHLAGMLAGVPIFICLVVIADYVLHDH
jgi:hypothetical protein